jgi:RNA polymerase sigma-70 factor (ECF subfamily)
LNNQLNDIEKELLQQIAKDDETAFTTLFHTWRNKLYFFLFRIVNSPEIAEDILQDVFIKIWIDRTKLTTIDYFGSYLFMMARNHAINGLRRMAQETLILSELQRENAALELPVDETILQKQVQERLNSIIKGLPTRQREVYTLSREKGLRQEEIARQLNISISTVQNHMTQALHTIRQQLRHFCPAVLLCLIPGFEKWMQ